MCWRHYGHGLVLGLVARGKAKRGEISPARVQAGIVVPAVSLGLQILGGILLIALIGAGASSAPSTAPAVAAPVVTSAPSTTPAPVAPVVEAPAPVDETTTAAPAPASAPADVIADGDWTLDALQVDDGSFGVTGATARITNAGGAVQSASFTVTVEGDGGAFTNLVGFASDVTAGDTVTVSLVGSDVVTNPVATDLEVSAF